MKQLYRLLVAVLLILITSCGGGGGSDSIPAPPSPSPSSAKAITAFSFGCIVGTINAAGKSIAVYMPPGTDVTAMAATFTTTGASVEVGSTVQVSGTSVNDFTNPVVYTVTAADATTQNYTVTVTVSASLSGFLDTTFGTCGKVTTPIGSAHDYALALGIQSDGKIVAAGYSYNGSNYDFALVRYNADGSLDPGFGTGGKVTTPVGSADAAARALGIQSDGKIVVAGYYTNSDGNYDFALARYNADGSLDPTFGTGGKVTTPIGSLDDLAYALGIQSDGKIVAAGYSYNGSNNDFALVRYNANGSLDLGFGTGGKVTTAVGSGYDVARALGIQADGKIVAAGSSSNGSNDDFALVRYNADGGLDPGFGTGGKVTTPIGSRADVAAALGIQPDGKIVASGYSYNGSNDDFALVRYNSNGALDAGFGTGGKVTTPVGSGFNASSALGIQSDGKIVAAGISYDVNNSDIVLARYKTDGSLDTGFYLGGIVTTSIGNGYDVASALGIQADGKIVVAGYYANNAGNYDFALMRYRP